MLRNPVVRRIIVGVTLTTFFSACYVQRPLVGIAPPASTRIVALVTDTGAVMMSNAIGAGAVQVEGVVVEADGESWKLQMIRVDQRGGFSTQWNRELVTFPRMALTNAQVRQLDKKRSWVFAGIFAAAVLAGTILFGGVLGGGSEDPVIIPPA